MCDAGITDPLLTCAMFDDAGGSQSSLSAEATISRPTPSILSPYAIDFVPANVSHIITWFLQDMIQANNSDVIFLTETWLNESYTDAIFDLINYQIFRDDRSRTTGGGCANAILVCRSILSCSSFSFVRKF